MQTGRLVRCVAVLAVCCSSLGCLVDTQAPRGAQVSCGTTADCPGDLVCLPTIGRCRSPAADCVRSTASGFDIEIDGVPCGAAGDVCVLGVCTAPFCGDSATTGSETCDDGDANSDARDAPCRTDCSLRRCGDRITDSDEGCDDGNAVEGDGCDSNCAFSGCGNDIQDGNEECDDGNITDGDGCDSNCRTTGCGNGVVTPPEICDDGNTDTEPCTYGDPSCISCNASCDFVIGEPRYCGNGKFVGESTEACDDGNADVGDGCSDGCAVEPGYRCEGEPSYCALIIYVDKGVVGATQDGTSWTSAFDNLADGLADTRARGGRQDIWIAEGTYYPDEGNAVTGSGRDATFSLVNEVRLFGGFAGTELGRDERNPDATVHRTILHGDLDQNDPGTLTDNAQTVVNAFKVEGAMLADLTIRGGYADGTEGIVNPTSYGAAVYLDGGQIVIDNCVLEDHYAAEDGGAIYAGLTDLEIRRSEFRNNSVNDEGGALMTMVATLTITGTVFEDNSAVNTGGGAYILSSSGTMASTRFSRNTVSVGDGGGLDLSSSSWTLTDVTFEDNTTAEDGGGLYGVIGKMTIVGGQFARNIANQGAGMWFGLAAVRVVDCTFNANQAPTGGGGAMVVNGGDLKMLRSGFYGNSAATGGALVIGSSAVIADSVFDANTATGTAGGLLAITQQIELIGTTFVSNTAPSAAAIHQSGAAVIEITNCVLWGNGTTPVVTEAGAGPLTISHSCIEGFADAGNLPCCAASSCTPGFDAGGVKLAAGSICIDAGDTDALDAESTTDLDDQPRVVDDPSTTDTGSGGPPVVDIGAYEFQP